MRCVVVQKVLVERLTYLFVLFYSYYFESHSILAQVLTFAFQCFVFTLPPTPLKDTYTH